jgi:hypothetical protein
MSIGCRGDPQGTSLLLSRPRHPASFLDHITESVPLKFALAEGAAQFDFAVRHGDHFPVSLAGTALDVNFLSRLERVWVEYRYVMGCHDDLGWRDYGVGKLFSVRPEIGKFGRDQGARKILPEAYG